MKLYVWEGALADYYGGLIVALAPNLRQAKIAARKAYGLSSASLESDLKEKPKIIPVTEDMESVAFTCSGGS